MQLGDRPGLLPTHDRTTGSFIKATPSHGYCGHHSRKLTLLASKSRNPFSSPGAGGKKQAKHAEAAKREKGVSSKQACPQEKQQQLITLPFQTIQLVKEEPDQLCWPQEELTNTEIMETPKWGTFCNHMSGEWLTQYSAYTPWEAQPEPVWVGSDSRYLTRAFCRSVEHRAQNEEEEEVLVRKTARAGSVEALRDVHVSSEGIDVADDDVDVEALTFNTDGVVIFNGAHYSAGPDFIGPPNFKILKDDDDDDDNDPTTSDPSSINPALSAATSSSSGSSSSNSDAAAEEEDKAPRAAAPTTTSIIEHCLTDWGTRTRLRLKATVKIGHLDNGEVDVQVIRLVLLHDTWLGEAGASLPKPLQQQQQPQQLPQPVWATPCTKLPRASAAALSGSWKIFTVSATSIEEEDPLTGEVGVNWVYTGSEDVQQWELPSSSQQSDEGGTLWLPGGAVVTFKMLNLEDAEGEDEHMASTSTAAQHYVSMTGPPKPRGFMTSLTWIMNDGTMMQIERDYDGEGYLREVRHASGVKGGWSGGSM